YGSEHVSQPIRTALSVRGVRVVLPKSSPDAPSRADVSLPLGALERLLGDPLRDGFLSARPGSLRHMPMPFSGALWSEGAGKPARLSGLSGSSSLSPPERTYQSLPRRGKTVRRTAAAAGRAGW